MTTKLGLQDANGKIVKDEIKKALAHRIKDESKLEEAVAKCAVDKDTAEETSGQLWWCMIKQYRAHSH